MPNSRASGIAVNWAVNRAVNRTMDRAMNCTFRILIAVASALLSGCAADMASRILVEPDRYILYTCKELTTQAQINFNRQHELELLMAKAGSGAGQVASAMAYQPEHAQLRGEMTQLRKAADERKCPPLPTGPVAPATGTSTTDRTVR